MSSIEIANEAAMLTFGRSFGRSLEHRLVNNLEQGCVLFLSGPLGSGKTTLIRGVLSGFGFDGIVSSPTYTLVEPYTVNRRHIYHFDLYRLTCPADLEMIGIRDMVTPETISLIEWPERGVGILPTPDYDIVIRYTQTGREVTITNHDKARFND